MSPSSYQILTSQKDWSMQKETICFTYNYYINCFPDAIDPLLSIFTTLCVDYKDSPVVQRRFTRLDWEQMFIILVWFFFYHLYASLQIDGFSWNSNDSYVNWNRATNECDTYECCKFKLTPPLANADPCSVRCDRVFKKRDLSYKSK